ncbi:putative uncharacterized protein DDB_G0282133 isoform X2 [Amyelois transitella]|uniref:putative uncharacterized protein DDB_G0282133 isoform X2 n=1 Tax=Amyelois transitella TaxID=680683 RepID=UPI00298F6A82|nr:putative uncharacterized protein DDB_G0282133 isoform X2 [Amyelois transitella]
MAKRLLLARKDKLLQELQYYEKRIADFHIERRTNTTIEDDSSDSDTDLHITNNGPSTTQLKIQQSHLKTSLQATQELTSLQILQSEVTVLVTDPVIVDEPQVSEPGVWREVIADCRIDLVPFVINFHIHNPNAKFGAPSFRNVKVSLVKKPHEVELVKSALAHVTTPSDAVEVLRSYSVAHRSRRTTLVRLAEKYNNLLFMEPLSEGGYVLKCAGLLEVRWTLQNKWSPLTQFQHRMRFDLEYMDESYIKIITQYHRQLSDPSIVTDERTALLSKIINTCLEAKGPTQELYESMESDPDTAQSLRKRRTTLDQEAAEGKKRDDDIMAPPKSLPKKMRVRADNGRHRGNDSADRQSNVGDSVNTEVLGDNAFGKIIGNAKNKNRKDNVSELHKDNEASDGRKDSVAKSTKDTKVDKTTKDTASMKDIMPNSSKVSVASVKNKVSTKASDKGVAKSTKDNNKVDEATKNIVSTKEYSTYLSSKVSVGNVKSTVAINPSGKDSVASVKNKDAVIKTKGTGSKTEINGEGNKLKENDARKANKADNGVISKTNVDKETKDAKNPVKGTHKIVSNEKNNENEKNSAKDEKKKNSIKNTDKPIVDNGVGDKTKVDTNSRKNTDINNKNGNLQTRVAKKNKNTEDIANIPVKKPKTDNGTTNSYNAKVKEVEKSKNINNIDKTHKHTTKSNNLKAKSGDVSNKNSTFTKDNDTITKAVEKNEIAPTKPHLPDRNKFNTKSKIINGKISKNSTNNAQYQAKNNINMKKGIDNKPKIGTGNTKLIKTLSAGNTAKEPITKIPQKLTKPINNLKKNPLRISPRKLSTNLKNSIGISKTIQKPITSIPRLLKKPVVKT